MPRYFGTFIPGTEEIVHRALCARLGAQAPIKLLPGAVEFETPLPYSDLNLFCLTNVFALLYRAPGDDLSRFLDTLLSAPDVDWDGAGKSPTGVKTFRVVASKENRLAAVDPALRARLEGKLRRATGLRLARAGADTEFWVLTRREGMCRFLRRLSRHRAYDRLLHPGELRPELAYMLCLLSAPGPKDTVLDPFCGYGAIPEARCRRFPYARCYAFDIDPEALKAARGKFKKPDPRRVFERRDVFTLPERLEEGSLDAIVTDPPWGLYEPLPEPAESFYARVLSALCPLLKPGGRMVLLTARREEILSAAKGVPALTLRERYDILVSGKKAGIFLLTKEPSSSEK